MARCNSFRSSRSRTFNVPLGLKCSLTPGASLAELEPLAAADRPFRHTARELLALSAWRNGDAAAAKRWLDLIATDAETPAGTRQRMEVLMTLSNDKAKT